MYATLSISTSPNRPGLPLGFGPLPGAGPDAPTEVEETDELELLDAWLLSHETSLSASDPPTSDPRRPAKARSRPKRPPHPSVVLTWWAAGALSGTTVMSAMLVAGAWLVAQL